MKLPHLSLSWAITVCCGFLGGGALLTPEVGARELITPIGVVLEEGDALGGFAVENLINNVGLSEPATLDNYEVVFHSDAGRWVTATAGSPNYFDAGYPPPVMTFTLDDLYSLTDLVVWGYAGGGNNNEASGFLLEFSADGGNSYPQNVYVETPVLLVDTSYALSFGQAIQANKIRMTMTENGGKAGFIGQGTGDRVGLGEVKFIGTLVGGAVTAPVIQQSPASTIVREGSTVTFGLQVAGTAPFSYQWQHNGVDLEGQKADTLVLENVGLADGGEYRCVVSNAAGSATTAAAQLNVVVPIPGALLVTPTAVEQVEGDTLDGYPLQNLINDSGLAEPADADNFLLVPHHGGTWVTATGTWPGNYFDAEQLAPQLIFDLDAEYQLTHLVIWGYGDNNNEATDFVVEFSVDGGLNFDHPTTAASSQRLGNHSAALPFGTVRSANAVRVTMTQNAGNRGFDGVGPGDRVGLGEVKFLATTLDPEPIRPTLNVQVGAQGITLSWVEETDAFTLESTDSLPGNQWTTVPGVVNQTVTLNPTETARWFRLAR